MANPERGEMTLVTAAGTFTLRVTTNACCELEAQSGKSFEEHLEAWQKQHRATAFRWLVWVALQDRHADVATTPEAVGRLIDAADPAAVTKVMTAFILLYRGEIVKLIRDGILKERSSAGAKADPPVAQATTAGVSSTSTPAESA